MGGGSPKIQKPPEVEEMPPPVAPPVMRTIEEMGEAKKKVRERTRRQAGRASTILANRMMQKRSDISILNENLA
jgi:hypothetical protein